MKTLIVILLISISFSGFVAGQNSVTNRNIIRMGAAYARFGEDDGFTFFNEYQFRLGNKFSVGPNFYFTRTGYFLDNKSAITYLLGVDLNVYYSLLKSENTSISIGTGYSFRHQDFSMNFPGFFGPDDNFGLVQHTNQSGAVINFIYENKISEK
jgi:hypothetical protein